MNLKKWIKLAAMSGTMVLLTACSSMHKNHDDTALNDANASYDNGAAQTAALGDDSNNYGDQAGMTKHAQNSNSRVYYFDFDSDAVHAQDKPAIVANATYLNNHAGSKTLLEGHTDPRGSREYNIGLGERRAKSVASIMTAKGTSPKQIRVVSYGSEKLASKGHTEADYQQDRRVALDYLQR